MIEHLTKLKLRTFAGKWAPGGLANTQSYVPRHGTASLIGSEGTRLDCEYTADDAIKGNLHDEHRRAISASPGKPAPRFPTTYPTSARGRVGSMRRIDYASFPLPG